jgi:hypothetical protein
MDDVQYTKFYEPSANLVLDELKRSASSCDKHRSRLFMASITVLQTV